MPIRINISALSQTILILLLAVSGLQAGNTEWINFLPKDSLTVGRTLVTQDLCQGDITVNPGDWAVENRVNLVRLVYNRSQLSDVEDRSFTYEVGYVIYFTGVNALPVRDTLRISKGASDKVYEAVRVHNPGGWKAKIKIEYVGGSGTIPEDIHLELGIVTDKWGKLNAASQAGLGYDATSDELYWNYMQGAEFYEIEWAWLDAESDLDTADVWDYATRIALGAHRYKPEWTYREGTVWCRARAVGRFIEGVNGDYSYKKYSAWSATVKVTINSGSRFEPGRNYQFTQSFAEEGKSKKVLSYFDGGLKVRQALTSLSSDTTTVIVQSEYDFEGRATLQTVPIPVPGNDLSWRSGLYRSNGSVWDRSDFAAGNPSLMDTLYGAARYYSANNDFGDRINRDFIPNAFGQPYTQTEFTRDATGRIARQGGIGPDHQIGGGHDSRFYYADAASLELARMFGSNVGNANHYLKKMAVDPNGQVSLVWQDESEKVIATALAGDAPGNLIELSNVSLDTLTEPLDAHNTLDADGLGYFVDHTILNEYPNKQYSFSYDLQGVKQQLECLCVGCRYELSFEILGPNGGPVDLTYGGGSVSEIRDTLGTLWETSCATDRWTAPSFTFTAVFDSLGDYRVIKRLRAIGPVDEQALVDSLLSCPDAPQLDTFLTQYRDSVDTWPCDANCDSIAVLLLPEGQSLTQHFIDSVCSGQNHLTGAIIAETECRTLYIRMLQDFRPGGWLYDSTAWAFVVNDSARTDSLVQTHREYCHYTACLADTASRLYDIRMSGVYEWNDALTLGYNNPLSSPKADPWFAAHGGFALQMDDSLNTVYRGASGGMSTWLDPNGSPPSGFYDSCSGDTLCEDTLYWYFFRGAYAHEKLRMYNQWKVDSLGCDFYYDQHALLPPAGDNSRLTGAMAGYTDAGMQENCNAACGGRIESWMLYLSDSAGFANAGDSLAVQRALLDFCLNSCPCENPNGVLADSFVVWGYLDSVKTLLGSPDSRFVDSLAVVWPYDTLILNGQPYEREVTIFDPALMAALSAYNGAWDSNWPGSIDIDSDPILQHSFANDSSLTVTAEAVELRDSVYGLKCKLIHLVDGAGAAVDLTDVVKIRDPLKTALPGGLLSPYTYNSTSYTYQGVEVEVVTEALNGRQSLSTAYLYTGSGCSFTVMTDTCQQWEIPTDSLDVELFPSAGDWRDSCRAQLYAVSDHYATLAWQQAVNAYLDEKIQAYRQACFSDPLLEHFEYEHSPKVYHYMLYYYDQAGNLVQTVPPEGVELLTPAVAQKHLDGTAAAADEPQHRLATRYAYNSLNQLIWQSTPDGGETEFWYDGKDRLRFTQDARQEQAGHYAYTRYDELGRTVEAGQVEDLSSDPSETQVNDLDFPERSSFTLSDITRTFYDGDEAYNTSGGFQWQENLRNRVAAVRRENSEGDVTSTLYYSYDDHGNVQMMQTHIPLFGRFTTEYVYDLISGNVRQVKYQEGEVDYFTHRYWYDADNRITEAWTSRNNVIWDRDAKYFYYPHGPLARVELGSDIVQGLDYYYSIHGWIKGVNVPGDSLALQDPGLDGERTSDELNAFAARDAYAFGLGFYEGDYYTIGGKDLAGAKQATWTQMGDSLLGSGLYNGNIPWMNTDLRDPEGVLETNLRGQSLMTYQYDQLNRLKRASGALDYASTTGWSFGSLGYRAFFDYDANGNILSLDRHAPRFIPNDPNIPNGPGTWQTVHFDGMTYQYNRDGNGKLLNNQLRHVEDPLERATGSGIAPSAYFDNDFSDQGNLNLAQVTDNYAYDAIGNLVRDSIEEIDTIHWDLYGKIAAVERTTAGWNDGLANLTFRYDGMGNRLSKEVETSSGGETWYYLRDAQGNPLAIYEREQDGDTLYTWLRELPLYGSDRLGLTKANTLISKKCVANCAVRVSDELPLRSLIFGEVFYDSPKTEDTASVETHLGEYIVGINTTDDTLNLDRLRLYEDESGDSVNLSGSLAPGQRLLIAYGLSDNGPDLQQISDMPAELLTGPMLWQQSLGLDDELGRLRLVQTSSGVTLDEISYGNYYGLVAENSYIADSLLDSLGQRSSLKSVQRVSYLRQGKADQVLGEKSVIVDLIDPFLDPQPYEGLADGVFELRKGARCYELKNHLGNVLVTVADWKVGREYASTDSVDWYEGAVLTQAGYFPFGWGLPGRQASSPKYRYGFNGMERDDEVKGNFYTTFFRFYNTHIARWLKVDPVYHENQSPYNGFDLNPVLIQDPTGGDGFIDKNNRVHATIYFDFSQMAGLEDERKQAYLQNVRQNIISTWDGISGSRNLNWDDFQVLEAPHSMEKKDLSQNENLITVGLTSGNSWRDRNSISYINGVGGNSGFFYFSNNGTEAGHEFGHLLGLSDRYHEGIQLSAQNYAKNGSIASGNGSALFRSFYFINRDIIPMKLSEGIDPEYNPATNPYSIPLNQVNNASILTTKQWNYVTNPTLNEPDYPTEVIVYVGARLGVDFSVKIGAGRPKVFQLQNDLLDPIKHVNTRKLRKSIKGADNKVEIKNAIKDAKKL